MGRTAYYLRILSLAKEGYIEEKRTIEFRAHAATMDPEEVKVRVKVLLVAVDLAG